MRWEACLESEASQGCVSGTPYKLRQQRLYYSLQSLPRMVEALALVLCSAHLASHQKEKKTNQTKMLLIMHRKTKQHKSLHVHILQFSLDSES